MTRIVYRECLDDLAFLSGVSFVSSVKIHTFILRTDAIRITFLILRFHFFVHTFSNFWDAHQCATKYFSDIKVLQKNGHFWGLFGSFFQDITEYHWLTAQTRYIFFRQFSNTFWNSETDLKYHIFCVKAFFLSQLDTEFCISFIHSSSPCLMHLRIFLGKKEGRQTFWGLEEAKMKELLSHHQLLRKSKLLKQWVWGWAR